MITKITCPSCQTLGQFAVDGGNFKGPYRCWKCRALFTLDMANSEVVSLTPLTEEEFQKIKAEQDAKKRGLRSPSAAQTAPKSEQTPAPQPPAHEENPIVWPRIPNKPPVENKEPELPKQTFSWPRVHNTEPDLTSSTDKPSTAQETTFPASGDRAQRPINGIILFQTITNLVDAEKLLNNEGCSVTRIAAPLDSPSGAKIVLRFHWSQYETVKRLLAQSGVEFLGIKPLPTHME